MTAKTLLIATIAVAVSSAAEPAAPKAARSVHLGYAAPNGDLFYNEMIVEQSVNGSYFMACGWNTGYFGIQQLNSSTNKVVIFSVWDPTTGDDPNSVKPEERVELLYEGERVRIRRFGGEGTGGQCMAPLRWEIGQTNRFLVRAEVQGNKTAYTAWVATPQTEGWWKLATFRTRTGGQPLSGYYAFVEDFRRDTKSAQEARRAMFLNGWVRSTESNWNPLNRARFTASSAEWEAKETINAGTNRDRYFLETGGGTSQTKPLNEFLSLNTDNFPPADLPTDLGTAKKTE